jgi:hypothetical protein
VRLRSLLLVPLLLLGCPGDDDDDSAPPADDDDDSAIADTSVPWTSDLPSLEGDIGLVRGFRPMRSILHFHSVYSHDACDGAGYQYGVLDEECLAEMRDGLCRVSIDLAYVSDHPSYAAFHGFEEILLFRDDDVPIVEGGETIANLIQCPTGHEVVYMGGIEDELMPLGLDRHAAEVGEVADELYNSSTQELFDAVAAAGGMVFQEHPEERDFETLEQRQDMGLVGLEVFQLHAMLDPGAREEIYGLEPFGWIEDIGPFTDPEATGEPDLLFAAFFQELGPNVERWDHLLQRGPSVGIAATDAHRNVLPYLLRDGERPDGYRRNFRWFSNVVLADDKEPGAADEAVAAGRLFMAFEIFGTPDDLAFWYDDGGGSELEMGESCAGCTGGVLHLDCPALSPASPRDGEHDPVVEATVFRDGEVWQTGCGTFDVTEAGVYRARVDITPHHLTPFLGDDPTPYLHPFPWVYTNAIRIQ